MRYLISFGVLVLILAVAIAVGDRAAARGPADTEVPRVGGKLVPHIGRVEVLNGCGVPGAAAAMSDFLRQRGFDVKDIANADTWNYQYSIVVANTADPTVARAISRALETDKLVLLQSPRGGQYDATVIVGEDYEERIK